MIGRKLLVYDSFEGLPDVDEAEKNLFGKGEYTGALDEVKKNVGKYGALELCEFVAAGSTRQCPASRIRW